jgi:hypothetical protein
MALGFKEGSGAELRGKEGGDVAPEEVLAASRYASSESFAYEGTPPPAQQMMDRQPPFVLGVDGEHDEGRIPASVFERDVSDPGKDWSMMSTESVFGLQVAPSCDFTGYFLAHPELMDITTPPRDSSVGAPATPNAVSTPPPFESIPELGDAAPSYSFAFPKYVLGAIHRIFCIAHARSIDGNSQLTLAHNMQIDGRQGVLLQEKPISRAAAHAESDSAIDDDGHAAAGGGDQQQTGTGARAGSSEGRHVLVDALLLLMSNGMYHRRQPARRDPLIWTVTSDKSSRDKNGE